jgi:hypothetical protein
VKIIFLINDMKFKIFSIPVFVIFLAACAWFFLSEGSAGKAKTNPDFSASIFKEEKNEDAASSSIVPPASAQTKKYENAQYDSSFNYPDTFVLKEFPEDGGKTVLIIQNAKTNQTVQIHITSYDDPDFAVSAEQVKRDIPDLPFSNSLDVTVGGKGKGVAFFSENSAFGGQTAEVWFADGKLFFQATASAKDARLLEEIIKSWRFK